MKGCNDCRHTNLKLRRLEIDECFTAGFDRAIVKSYRKRMQLIRSARDERDFYALKSLRYEKLKGKRSHQRSMRLNSQYRLIMEIEQVANGNGVVVRDIEDYH